MYDSGYVLLYTTDCACRCCFKWETVQEMFLFLIYIQNAFDVQYLRFVHLLKLNWLHLKVLRAHLF